ncbi:MAG TPA: hypothetical protein EYG03_27385 [Planctomycetes bacterium]|nr:hypothetical protein [Fuerstiella sp.]HIK95688.1 hypothetical protein [Planctomycetota bacterium]
MKSILISVLFAVVAFFLAAARINHGLIDSSLPSGPGLTLDESFNIGQGIYVLEAFLHHGPLLFTPSVAEEVFGDPVYLPDFPPLGRVILGAAHQATSWAIPGAEKSTFNVPAARLGSCFALAVTVLLLMEFVRRRYDMATAIAAAVLLLLMPRVIGHARLATQEMGTVLAWLATLVPLLAWWTKDTPPTNRQSLISGLLWGLLMLTKVQGLLLPPLVIVWAIWCFRWSAIRPLALWGVTGLVVFYAGWPWLWLDPLGHTLQYVKTTADRPTTLYVWYLGQRFADKAVPWHFPFVMTLATLPVSVMLFALWRVCARQFTKVETLAVASVLWPLIVFAVPGTPVYDGVRLYVVIMPLIAFIAARGLVSALRLISGRLREFSGPDSATAPRWKKNVARCFCVVALITTVRQFSVQGPFCLEDYSLSVLGTQGAVDVLGLEASYWSDGLNGDFWMQVPENSTVYVAPVSHQFQLSDIHQLVPIVRKRNIRLLPFEYQPEKQRGLVLLNHRLADLPPDLRKKPPGAKLVAESRYCGVVLARLIDTTDGTWSELAGWPKK